MSCLKCRNASRHFQPGEGPSAFSVIVKSSSASLLDDNCGQSVGLFPSAVLHCVQFMWTAAKLPRLLLNFDCGELSQRARGIQTGLKCSHLDTKVGSVFICLKGRGSVNLESTIV